MADHSNRRVTLLCRPSKHLTTRSDPAIHWLIGSPFFPPLTVATILRRLSSSSDLRQESDELRALIPRGFEVIGAIASGAGADARTAVDAAIGLRKLLYGEVKGEDRPVVGAVAAGGSGSVDLNFFVLESGNVEAIASVVQEENPEKYVWENVCLLLCVLPIKLPVYYPLKNPSG